MRIIVAGAGDLGTYLIEQLSAENHDISVVDKTGEKLEKLSFKHDVETFKGSVLSYDNMVAVGVPKADLFIAVTESEELNLMSAILAKRVGAKRVIARVRHYKLLQHNNIFDFTGLGIDEIISPDALVADEIALLLDKQAFSHLVKLKRGKYYLAGLLVSEEKELIGHSVRQLAKRCTSGGVIPVGIVRDGVTHRVLERSLVNEGDQLYFIVTERGIQDMVKLRQNKPRHGKRAMILGGSRAGIETTRRLENKGYQVTIVEGDREVAEEMADFLPEALIIHGDTQEPGFLEDHDVGDMDAVVAATGNPELNIISCLIAKQHGVRHTVALVKDTHYLKKAHEFGVDTLINKKFIAASVIARHVKKGNVLSVTRVPELDMEVFEFVVKEGSPIAGKQLGGIEMVIEAEVVIGGVMRGGEAVEPAPAHVFLPGDHVIVACHTAKRAAFQELL